MARPQRRRTRHQARSRRLFRETTKAWVNANGSPTWLKDGSFLWFSERSGFKHLYHYRADGTLVRQVTNGRWEIRSLYGVDEARGVVYFDAGARRHIDTDIFRIGLNGEGLTRVSTTDGTHRAIFNPSFSQYIDVWSDAVTPTQVRLHRADGTEVRVIDANPVASLSQYELSKPEFVEVKARDGFVMDAMLIKPPDFNPSRRYPGLPADLRRADQRLRAQPVGRHDLHVSPAARAAWRDRLGARQPQRRRQGRRGAVADLREAR